MNGFMYKVARFFQGRYGIDKLFDLPDDAKIRFNDSDIVTGGRGYNAWWSNEYERREADDL